MPTSPHRGIRSAQLGLLVNTILVATKLVAGLAGVLAIETLKIRWAGTGYYVDIHVQADPDLSLHDAHFLSGRVKSAIRDAVPRVLGVLVHMEPFEEAASTALHADRPRAS